ncbi:MAG: hypothetical protein ACK5XN_39905 [Bacteroidota bacterium]
MKYHSSKKKWTKKEINEIVNLRQKGKKVANIAEIYQVTENALRKALYRHLPEYQNKNIDCSTDPKFVNYNTIVNWAKENNLYLSHSKIQNVISVNRIRMQKNQPIFIINEKKYEEQITKKDCWINFSILPLDNVQFFNHNYC